MNGIELIKIERERQIKKEGFDADHDSKHDCNELTDAALCYICNAPELYGNETWPWEISWWKPSYDPIRNLVKAGALIAAEIDRIQNKK